MKNLINAFIILFIGPTIFGCESSPENLELESTHLTTSRIEVNEYVVDSISGHRFDENFIKLEVMNNRSVLPGWVELYTEKDFKGERFLVNEIGNFSVNDSIDIRSVKLIDEAEISFDFGTECNAIGNGTFTYVNQSLRDIYGYFSCDPGFAKIVEVNIRRNSNKLKTSLIVYEKTFLQGDEHLITLPEEISKETQYKTVDSGFISGQSFQIPPYCKVRLFSDKLFKELAGQIETSNVGMDKYYVPLPGAISFSTIRSFTIEKAPTPTIPPSQPQLPVQPPPPPRLNRR